MVHRKRDMRRRTAMGHVWTAPWQELSDVLQQVNAIAGGQAVAHHAGVLAIRNHAERVART